MAIRIAAFAAFIAAGYTDAAAQNVGGRYLSEGTTTTGSSFSVTVKIVITSEKTYRVKFSDGFAGICMLKGTTFAVATIVHGAAGLGIYEVSSDGGIEGSFIDDYHGEGSARRS